MFKNSWETGHVLGDISSRVIACVKCRSRSSKRWIYIYINNIILYIYTYALYFSVWSTIYWSLSQPLWLCNGLWRSLPCAVPWKNEEASWYFFDHGVLIFHQFLMSRFRYQIPHDQMRKRQNEHVQGWSSKFISTHFYRYFFLAMMLKHVYKGFSFFMGWP